LGISSKGRDEAASEARKEIGYSLGFSTGFSPTFDSWELLASCEGAGFVANASRIARLRRFRASSRAAPFVNTLEICMARSFLG
jgi:hypothetical protein